MSVYIDIIFIENLLMNYIILFVTGTVLKYKIDNKRIILSSILGSIYASVMYINIVRIVNNVIPKFILSVIMVQIAYKCKGIKNLIKDLMVFYLISFSFGGAAFFLLYYIKPEKIKIVNGNYIGLYPLKILILSGIIASIIIIISLTIIKKVKIKKELYCKLAMKKDKGYIEAFIDSGNMLKDPITNNPVIVVEEEIIKRYYSKELLEYIEIIMKGGTSKYNELIKDEISKIRIIPFSSIGKENGMMVGIKTEKLYIYYEEELYEVEDAIIGVYKGNLLKNKNCKAILGIEVIERGKRKNESLSYN